MYLCLCVCKFLFECAFKKLLKSDYAQLAAGWLRLNGFLKKHASTRLSLGSLRGKILPNIKYITLARKKTYMRLRKLLRENTKKKIFGHSRIKKVFNIFNFKQKMSEIYFHQTKTYLFLTFLPF